MVLEIIQRTFDACLRAAGIFERDVPGNQLFEAEVLRKEGHNWLAIAAGVGADTATDVFPSHSTRAERATIPLRLIRGGQASLLFVVRPFENPSSEHALKQITPFSSSEGIPFVEIRPSFLRLWDLPETSNRIQSLRWEIDPVNAQTEPIEAWLRAPSRLIGFNPAHCPSHLHINSVRPEDEQMQTTESATDLRLGIGAANPLAVILSIAAWLRAN